MDFEWSVHKLLEGRDAPKKRLVATVSFAVEPQKLMGGGGGENTAFSGGKGGSAAKKHPHNGAKAPPPTKKKNSLRGVFFCVPPRGKARETGKIRGFLMNALYQKK